MYFKKTIIFQSIPAPLFTLVFLLFLKENIHLLYIPIYHITKLLLVKLLGVYGNVSSTKCFLEFQILTHIFVEKVPLIDHSHLRKCHPRC